MNASVHEDPHMKDANALKVQQYKGTGERNVTPTNEIETERKKRKRRMRLQANESHRQPFVIYLFSILLFFCFQNLLCI